jgi:hypothetical protein
MNRNLWLVGTLMLLAGCATEYAPSYGGDGYSETQLSETSFQITFRGNTKTTPERAYDFAMLRAAEITISKGRQFFKVSSLASGDNGMAGAMINGAFIAKKKPEVALSIKLLEKKTSDDCLEAAFVRKSIRAKYQMTEG